MCIKYVYYNTYSDDQFDITERVESCTPGYICPNPRILQFDREYACPRDQAKASQARGDRLPGSAAGASTPSPRSLSPTSASPDSRAGSSDAASGADRADHPPRRRRRRTSDVYVNGTKVSSTSTTSASSKPPSSPRTMPIPIQRAATMTYGGMEPPPERGRRPIIVEERVPSLYQSTPRMMPIPLPTHADIYNHTTTTISGRPRPSSGFRDFRDFREFRDLRDSRPEFRPEFRPELRNDLREFRPVGLERTSSLRRREPATPPLDSAFLSPNRARFDRSPQGYGSAEDEQERAERRRRRRAARERASVMPSSLPAMGATDVFGSSPSSTSGVGSGVGSGMGSSAATSASTSPAVSAVKKELRWEDEQRRLQNERISRRPKMPRVQPVPTSTTTNTNPKLQGEVKSILKNTSTSAGTSPAPPAEGRSRASSRASSTRPPSASRPSSRPPSSSRRASFVGPVGDLDDLFTTGVSGLNISTPPPPPPGPGPMDELAVDDVERNRLRNRFSMPPRRYTAGGAFKRRTEIWYPEEGRYRFM
ncbi:hypothetical protein HMPREF1624_02201 [Sporothrix schenckii ATCC 58251]|uniref:Uncharacterized protein n=1 Tax=Sporothrix schenckii (strain ATCC 58251 / de Perez 2211183) TaxID=1391915 RepID=U7Q2P0_SPOS1|nr:hypothetical protein HMPREF1624_02201 [Sporothrix schenckii ATCC 58251]